MIFLSLLLAGFTAWSVTCRVYDVVAKAKRSSTQ